MRLPLGALFVVACATSAPSGATSTVPGEGPGDVVEAPATPVVVDVRLLGDPCDDAGGCPAGMTCLRYYGFGGPSGPEFRSCEVACGPAAAACPDGASCTTIADGPGAVCRASAP